MLRSTVLLALSLASLAHEETALLQVNVNSGPSSLSLKSVATSVTSVTKSVNVPITKTLTDAAPSGGSSLTQSLKTAATTATATKNVKGKASSGWFDSLKSSFHSGWQGFKQWCGISPKDDSPEAKAKRKQEEAEEAREEQELEEKCKHSPNDPDCESVMDSVSNFLGFGKKNKEEGPSASELEMEAKKAARLKEAEESQATLDAEKQKLQDEALALKAAKEAELAKIKEAELAKSKLSKGVTTPTTPTTQTSKTKRKESSSATADIVDGVVDMETRAYHNHLLLNGMYGGGLEYHSPAVMMAQGAYHGGSALASLGSGVVRHGGSALGSLGSALFS